MEQETKELPMDHASELSPPEQTFLGGEESLGRLLEEMQAHADLAIDRAVRGQGPADRRRTEGEFEIHFAMRPEFGPANAMVFSARARKLAALARALGLEPADPAGDLDGFVGTVLGLTRELEAKGFGVEHAHATAGAILWSPPVAGRRILVTDRSRTMPETIPYEALAPSRPKAEVHPRVTLYCFPPRRMSAERSRVRREQPGSVEGALDSVVVLRLQAPQSNDQDDGRLWSALVELLFPSADADANLADLASDLGAESAVRRHGVLWISSAEPAPDHIPPVGEGATHVTLWSRDGGMDVHETLIPR